jgi:hypothetical protein
MASSADWLEFDSVLNDACGCRAAVAGVAVPVFSGEAVNQEVNALS